MRRGDGIGSRRPRAADRQRGAALATSLFFLVVLTVLGLAAMQSGRIDLRLSLNEESRIAAQQSAQTALEKALEREANFEVLANAGELQSCIRGASLDASALRSATGFQCPGDKINAALSAGTYFSAHTYVAIRRERVGDQDFAPPAALRRGDSGDRYRLASFTITSGYDRTAERQGAAEIQQGLYRKIAVVDNVSLQ